ncbi:MAG: ATP-binding cassette domain-containing protein, partial [Candidatus Dormibacteraeota bacterium]|nr:ATP-binding cassette domain-containing protein [Candidatus Dormibacteraeota bacterium]
MREPAISVQSLSKRYRLYRRRTQTLKELVLQRSRGEWEDLWALDDVSFQVDRGEFLGVIGPNGSGKSTLLKVLGGILRPDRGTVTVAGQVAALLELGAGFHPEYTGRENVYLYGTLLGLTRREVSRRYGAIVDFSELGGFMDYPVKNYSSGMYVRLGLSVAVQLDPEILLIDEVFAVGDASFQQRCLEHLYRLRGRGCTIVLVSHDTSAVRRFCERAIWIEHGGVVAIGSSDQVANAYLESVADGGPPAAGEEVQRVEADPALALRDLELTGADGLAVGEVRSGAGIRVDVDYEAFRPLDDVNLTVTVFRDDGVRCLD